MTIEVMQLALDALQNAQDVRAGKGGTKFQTPLHSAAIASLINAIEQAAPQAPVLVDIKQYQMQMEAITNAAIGFWQKGEYIHPDLNTSALRDVATLYAKFSELFNKQAKTEIQKLSFRVIVTATLEYRYGVQGVNAHMIDGTMAYLKDILTGETN